MLEQEEKSCRHFQLRPFTPEAFAEKLVFSGSLGRLPGVLLIEYQLAGMLHDISWPSPDPASTRRHDLWRHTCFEFFIGRPGQKLYWEANLSPNGAWNFYRFNDYRQGMCEEAVSQPLSSVVRREAAFFDLSCKIDIQRLFADDQDLQVGVAGVIALLDGQTTYWAIDHPRTIPDFHDRRGFVLALPGIEQGKSGRLQGCGAKR